VVREAPRPTSLVTKSRVGSLATNNIRLGRALPLACKPLPAKLVNISSNRSIAGINQRGNDNNIDNGIERAIGCSRGFDLLRVV
jgi:hypothetical protein